MASKKVSSAGNQQERPIKEKVIRFLMGVGVIGIMYLISHSISYSVMGTPPLLANLIGLALMLAGFFIAKKIYYS